MSGEGTPAEKGTGGRWLSCGAVRSLVGLMAGAGAAVGGLAPAGTVVVEAGFAIEGDEEKGVTAFIEGGRLCGSRRFGQVAGTVAPGPGPSFAPPGGTALVSVRPTGLAGVGNPEAVGVVAGMVDGHGWSSFVRGERRLGVAHLIGQPAPDGERSRAAPAVTCDPKRQRRTLEGALAVAHLSARCRDRRGCRLLHQCCWVHQCWVHQC